MLIYILKFNLFYLMDSKVILYFLIEINICEGKSYFSFISFSNNNLFHNKKSTESCNIQITSIE